MVLGGQKQRSLCHFWPLALRLAPTGAKAKVLAALYGRLNLNLVRANATAILSRCFVSLAISNNRVHLFLLQLCIAL